MTDTTAARVRAIVTAESRPSIPKHIKLRHDPSRDRWIILAPERVFDPDATAIEVFRRIDGQRTVAEITALLAAEYNAPPAEILGDVIAMLQDLADKGVIKA